MGRPYKKRFGEDFAGPAIPFGPQMEYLPHMFAIRCRKGFAESVVEGVAKNKL